MSAFDRDRGSSPCYWALEAAASPHKDRTRWNNAIFAEEEADGDEAVHSDAGERNKERRNAETTEGREKKRETKKRTKRGRDREGDEERREV